ncbi:MAG: hypothetical protein LUH22_19975 [Bacteroides sp.]|nr:hypothetical protein [Bacteroides sp.]
MSTPIRANIYSKKNKSNVQKKFLCYSTEVHFTSEKSSLEWEMKSIENDELGGVRRE